MDIMEDLPSSTKQLGLNAHIPKILIDSNEGQADYVRILEEDDLFALERQRLQAGDILIDNLVIERKTKTDFVDSLRDGRLFRQLLVMKRLYRRRMLLIEGSAQIAAEFATAPLEGALTRITAGLQVPVLYCNSPQVTARQIRRIAIQLFGFSASSFSRSVGAANGFYEVNVLLGIPGVGLARARGLIRHFGSLQNVFTADEEQLSLVPGVGAFLARQLVVLFRGVKHTAGENFRRN